MKKLNFTIGADPEYNIIFGSQKISAHNIYRKIWGNKFNEQNLGYKVGPHGNIGWDNHTATGEFRPSPASTPSELVKNIKELIQTVANEIGFVKLSTLSYHEGIGGHLHFSVPHKEMQNVTSITEIQRKMSTFFYPCLCNDSQINLITRTSSKYSYGKLSDFRCLAIPEVGVNIGTQASLYGNMPIKDLYEFRTPSAEWLTTETIAQATICYAVTIYNEIVNNPKNIDKYRKLFWYTQPQAETLLSSITSNYTPVINKIKKSIKDAVETFELYKTYKTEIDLIFNSESIKKCKKEVNYEIFPGWNINLAKKRKENCPTKLVLDISDIIYNEDYKVKEFVEQLAQKIYVENLNLKNRYVFFGLRKGIEKPIAGALDEMIFDTKNIETQSDYSAVKNLLTKIKTKLETCHGVSLEEEIDTLERQLLWNKIDGNEYSPPIIIGIPYEDRKNNGKNTLQLVTEIESTKKTFLERNLLKDDRRLPVLKRGELWKLFNKNTVKKEIEKQNLTYFKRIYFDGKWHKNIEKIDKKNCMCNYCLQKVVESQLPTDKVIDKIICAD